jgi:hypothetical protein
LRVPARKSEKAWVEHIEGVLTKGRTLGAAIGGTAIGDVPLGMGKTRAPACGLVKLEDVASGSPGASRDAGKILQHRNRHRNDVGTSLGSRDPNCTRHERYGRREQVAETAIKLTLSPTFAACLVLARQKIAVARHVHNILAKD